MSFSEIIKLRNYSKKKTNQTFFFKTLVFFNTIKITIVLKGLFVNLLSVFSSNILRTQFIKMFLFFSVKLKYEIVCFRQRVTFICSFVASNIKKYQLLIQLPPTKNIANNIRRSNSYYPKVKGNIIRKYCTIC